MIRCEPILQVATQRRPEDLLHPAGGRVDRPLRAARDTITATSRSRPPTPPSRSAQGKVVKAVIVRCRKEQRRRDGSYIRFDENAAVLIKEDGEPVGTTGIRPVGARARDRSFMKIVSLARSAVRPWRGSEERAHRIRIRKNDLVEVITAATGGSAARCSWSSPRRGGCSCRASTSSAPHAAQPPEEHQGRHRRAGSAHPRVK